MTPPVPPALAKRCARCHLDKSPDHFVRNRSRTDRAGLSSWCRACQRAYRCRPDTQRAAQALIDDGGL